MLLNEEHRIRRHRNEDLFREVDAYCYQVKNLYNAVNYQIRQCDRIHRKLHDKEPLEDWERELVDRTNAAIRTYNEGRPENRQMRPVDGSKGFIGNAYFLSWYLKGSAEYKAMPYATCSQICIQELCRAWKSFFKARKAYRKDPSSFTGCPEKPGYLDKTRGRYWLVITSQNFRAEKDGSVIMPEFLKGIHIRARHENVHQIRIKTEEDSIRILLVYEQEELSSGKATCTMGIDLGVNNLITASWDSDHPPVIINGRALKSINQFYNKERARLQTAAIKNNQSYHTKRLTRLTQKRNNKVKDQIHKASRKVVELAQSTGVRLIVIGNNRMWKQNVDLKKRNNQNFVSIPHDALIDMIIYKAALVGIEVMTVEESYTSGTSYLDGEEPEKRFYKKSRRIHRGLFRSNTGICINADANAAYQMMKKAGVKDLKIKHHEQIRRIKVF